MLKNTKKIRSWLCGMPKPDLPWLYACAGIAVAVLAVFGQTIAHDFIDLDDGVYVTQNPRVAAGITGAGLVWAFTTFHGGFWIPLTWLSLMADQTLFGGGAWGYHLTNIILHAINSLLVLFVLFKMTRAFWPSLAAAALFAVHPMHVESVAWVSERKDVLYAFFFFMTILAHQRFAQKPEFFRGLLVFCLCACALMAKPMAMTLPLVLILFDYWPLERFSSDTRKNRNLLIEKIPIFILCAAAGILTFFTQFIYGGVKSFAVVGFLARVENAIFSYADYVKKILWPVDLAVFYPHPLSGLSGPVVFGAMMFLALVCIAAIKMRRKAPWLFTGWFFYLITLFPVIGLFQAGLQGMADRFVYIPSLGLFIIGSWGAARLAATRRAAKYAVAFIAATIIFIFTILSVIQAGHWKDSVTLFKHALKTTDNNYMVHEFLGASLAGRGQYHEAAKQFELSLGINPRHADAHYGLGVIDVNQEKFAKALKHFDAALKADSGHVESYYGMGMALLSMELFEKAQKNFGRALAIDPGHRDAAKNFLKTKQLMEQAGSVPDHRTKK